MIGVRQIATAVAELYGLAFADLARRASGWHGTGARVVKARRIAVLLAWPHGPVEIARTLEISRATAYVARRAAEAAIAGDQEMRLVAEVVRAHLAGRDGAEERAKLARHRIVAGDERVLAFAQAAEERAVAAALVV